MPVLNSWPFTYIEIKFITKYYERVKLKTASRRRFKQNGINQLVPEAFRNLTLSYLVRLCGIFESRAPLFDEISQSLPFILQAVDTIFDVIFGIMVILHQLVTHLVNLLCFRQSSLHLLLKSLKPYSRHSIV